MSLAFHNTVRRNNREIQKLKELLAKVERERDELKELIRWWAECRDMLLSGFTLNFGRNGWLESHLIMLEAEAALREAAKGD